jgi:WD40 repeat protein
MAHYPPPSAPALESQPGAPKRTGCIAAAYRTLIVLVVSCTVVSVIINGLYGSYICGPVDRLFQLSPCRSTVDVDGIVRHLTFAPDSHLLAITTIRSVVLWDVAANTIVRTVPFAGPSHPPINAQVRSDFSPDGSALATIGLVELQVIDIASGTVRYRIPVHERSNGGGVRFSPDGHFLAVSETVDITPEHIAGLVRIFDAANGRLIQTLPGDFQLSRYDLQFTPDSQHLVLWADPHDNMAATVQIWDIATQQYTDRVSEVDAVSPDASILYTDENDISTVYTLAATGDRYTTLQQIHRTCHSVWYGFVPQRDLIISVNNTYEEEFVVPSYPTTCMWRLRDGQIVWQSRAQGAFATVAPNGTMFAIDTSSGVQVWDIPAAWN